MVAFVGSVIVSSLHDAAPSSGTRKRRPVGTPLTWGEAMVAATYVFFLMFWVYGVVPHQWLAWADNELGWRPTSSSLGPSVHRHEASSRLLPFNARLPDAPRHHRRASSTACSSALHVALWAMWQDRGKRAASAGARGVDLRLRPPAGEAGRRTAMARTDANPPMPEFRDDYVLQEVDADYLAKAVKPKQFIHIDQSECIMCEGCVDICPWKCIHMVTPDAIAEADRHRAARASTRPTT